MKKILILLAIISLAAFTGCQQAATTSTTTKTLPDSAAQSYASLASGYANVICSSMAGWAQGGAIGSFGVKRVSAKTITEPTNGWYHITETASADGYSYDYDVYAKFTPATGTPTDVYLYGTVTINYSYQGSNYAYTFTYGSSSNPFHSSVTWNNTQDDVTSVSVSGTIAAVITAPNSAGTGTDTIELTMTFSNLSIPITSGADYPTGTVTIALKYNTVVQPDMTVTFDGDSTASWSYGGSAGTFTVTAASVNGS